MIIEIDTSELPVGYDTAEMIILACHLYERNAARKWREITDDTAEGVLKREMIRSIQGLGPGQTRRDV